MGNERNFNYENRERENGSSSSSSSSSSDQEDTEEEYQEEEQEDIVVYYYTEGEQEVEYVEEYESDPEEVQEYYPKGGTVHPADPFDPEKDAKTLRKAMKGLGTDEKAIIKVIARRTNAQRQEIAQCFKTMYGKDLIKDLKSELSGKLENLVVALMTPTLEFQAKELERALSGVGTDEDILVDLLCPATNEDIYAMQSAYEELFKRSLESDLESDTSGSFRRLMISLCQGGRSEINDVDREAAFYDAKALLKAGEKKLGTDESTFNAILCTRSYPQLQRIFKEYERITQHSLERAIKSEFSGAIKTGLLGIVKSATDIHEFYAERLRNSLKGFGTNDDCLVRIVTLRSEIDLEDIKEVFMQKYGKSLEKYVKKDTSGYYQKCLLEIIKT